MRKFKQRYVYPIILLRQLVKTDFKLRYQGSALGYLWSLLRPLALFIVLYVVFAEFLKVGKVIPHYPVYLLLGIVLWNYFAEVTGASVGAIVGRGDLLRKINFPKYVIVLSASFSALINLFLNFIIILCFMLATGVDVQFSLLYLFPLLIIELFLLSLALSFFLSAAFVRFRDISYIWEVVMQAAFYATPILYPLSFALDKSHKLGQLMSLNPMAQIIQDSRYILVTARTGTINSLYSTGIIRLIPIGITLLLVIISVQYFRMRSKYFAEEV